MFQKLKQFKDLREQAKQIQTTLAAETVEGSAGFGKIKIKMNGAQEALSVSIDNSLMRETEQTRLQEMIKDAINDAIKKGHKIMAEKMKSMPGMQMPGMK